MAFTVLDRDANGRVKKFSMIRPDCWHLHVRAGKRMKKVVKASAAVYGRATIMPNTQPIMTVAQALDYRAQIIEALVEEGFSQERATRFPQMTLYMHPGLTSEEIRRAKEEGFAGVKFYPKNPTHGTTGSQAGVPSLKDVMHVLEFMTQHDLALLVHGESAQHTRILELERHFVDEQLVPVHHELPELKIVGEHATTKELVWFVEGASGNVTATATPQHLWYTIDGLFEGGLRPFRYCLPLYKHEEDRAALRNAVFSGNIKFAAGDDSAPHPKFGLAKERGKLTDCGCAGAYVAPVSVPMYVEAADRMDALDQRFEDFMSRNGAMTRGLPMNDDIIVVERKPWKVPDEFPYGDGEVVVPLCAGETLEWQVVEA